jgi:antitoxin VapB
LIPSRKADSWDGLFELYRKGDVPKDFMGSADRRQARQDRDPFKGWKE